MLLGWRTWRYLQVDINTADQPLHLEKLRSWFTAYPFEERARFESDDFALRQIWQIGWRTARLDAHDTYMDTPYWERMQYIGDTRIQALISYSVAGDDRLPRQAIQAFNDSRIPDGITRRSMPGCAYRRCTACAPNKAYPCRCHAHQAGQSASRFARSDAERSHLIRNGRALQRDTQ